MERATSFGPTGADTKDSTLMAKNKDTDSSHGQMGESTEDSGGTANKMEEESSSERTGPKELAYGATERRSAGLTDHE